MTAVAEPQTILKSPALTREISRLQNAKATLKTKLNARNDSQHQIDDETIDQYGAFVDSIPQGGGGLDWSEIGYNAEPQSVIDGFDYAKTIYDNWDSSQTSLTQKFINDTDIVFMPLVDTSNANDLAACFYGCSSLIYVPSLNTNNVTDLRSTFNRCYSLQKVDLFNTSNVTSFGNAFEECRSIQEIPQFDTSNSTSFANTFYNCINLKTIPQLNFSKAINISNLFNQCNQLTTLGGFLNLGQAYLTTKSANYYDYTLRINSTLLTHDSLMNVINGLYDIATKGCNAQQLILGSTNLAKLSAEEISTATNKGWSLS